MIDSKHDLASTDEQLLLKRALASIENARRFQKIKQIVLTTLAFIAAFWFASKRPSPELNIECTILIFVGLIAAICTAKMMSLINKNTKVILNAIADLHQKLRAQQ